MHYLVTGGAGFIGNSLAKRLFAEGHQVTIIDNVNSYYEPSLKEARLASLPAGIKVFRVDLLDNSALGSIFAENKFDAICHLAAQAGVRYSLECPATYIESNYVGTFNILEKARQSAIKKIILASTSSVYGDDTLTPFVETATANSPLSIYAATKRGVEILASTYAHLYGMEITALRFFTVYGPWGRPDMALFSFTKKMLSGESIPVYNQGQLRRDFTYIDDIVNGFYQAVITPLSGFNIINLGNGQPVELMQFIAVLEEALGVKAVLDLQPMQPGDVHETYADITLAKTLLGYEPKTNIKQGVESFVEWYHGFYG